MKLLAITSCPNGIAHTYMAAENLQKAAGRLGVEIKVETQGGIGVENRLTEEEIREADAIIIAADRSVNKDRFAGKKLLAVGVQEGIRKPEELIQKALSGEVPVYQSASKAESASQQGKKTKPDLPSFNERRFFYGSFHCRRRIIDSGCIDAWRRKNTKGLSHSGRVFLEND